MSDEKLEVTLEVTSLIVTDVVLLCPHCNEMQDGFSGNPQGHEFTCVHCDKKYFVHNEADCEFL